MDKETSVKFFDEIAPRWDSLEKPAYKARIPAQLKKTGITQGDKVLDAACGTGILYPLLNEAKAEVLSLDISGGMLAELKKKHPQAKTVQADFIAALLPSKHFDKVLIFNAFPHFEDKPSVFAKAAQILKPNGYLYIFHSLTREELNSVHAKQNDTQGDAIPPDMEMFNYYKDAGFEHIRADDSESGYFSCGRLR